VLSGSGEHAADTPVALSPLQEVWLGQEVSQLQGRAQTLASTAPFFTHFFSLRHTMYGNSVGNPQEQYNILLTLLLAPDRG